MWVKNMSEIEENSGLAPDLPRSSEDLPQSPEEACEGSPEAASGLVPTDRPDVTREAQSKPGSSARGAPKGNTRARTHGLYSLRRRLNGAGITKKDGRSALERLKVDWKQDIRDARGELTPQQEALLEVAANTWLMLSTADDYILATGVVNKRKGAVRPIVDQRARLARTLHELLSDIGLERAAVPKKDLGSHLAARYGGNGAAKPQDERESAVDVTPRESR